MARGSADRYFQQDIKDTLKLVPEGIEGQVPYKGPVGAVLHQPALPGEQRARGVRCEAGLAQRRPPGEEGQVGVALPRRCDAGGRPRRDPG